jgi:hypothetical protein
LFAEGGGGGGEEDGVDGEDVVDAVDVVVGFVGQDDVAHADGWGFGLGQGEEGAARLGVQDFDVAADTAGFVARVDDVADEVAGAALEWVGRCGGVVEEDRLAVVERDGGLEGRLGVAVAVL